GVLIGSCVFGGGCLISLAYARNTDPVGAWRLAWAPREAPGRLERIEDLGPLRFAENSPPLSTFRYRYSFRLPDGSPMRGTSYTAASSEPRLEGIIVEYDRRDPRLNRIEGTRTGLWPVGYLALWMVPLVGLAITAGAIRYGLLRIRVFERGESAVATIVTYTL